MNKRRLFLLSIVWLVVFAWAAPVAQAATTSSGAAFVVTPVYPANQTGGRPGYFVLQVTPGRTYQLQVQVANLSQAEARTIRLTPVPATTTNVPDIDYTPSRQPQDPSARYTLNQFFSPPVTITLPAGTARIVTFTYAIPAQGFPGEILGSLYALDVTKTPTVKGQFALANHFARAVGIVLSTAPGQSAAPQLALGSVVPTITGNQSAVKAVIRNEAPQSFRDLALTAQVTRANNATVLFKKRLTKGAMAPTSQFTLTIPAGQQLNPGHYQLTLQGTALGKTFRLVRGFTVTAAAAHQAVIVHPNAPQNGIVWWLILAAVGFGGGATVLAVMIQNRKKRGRYAVKHS